MPVFYILLILGLVLLWFILSFCFKPFGKFANKLYGDAKRAMTEEENPASCEGAKNNDEKRNEET
jgi:hypothetical protein